MENEIAELTGCEIRNESVVMEAFRSYASSMKASQDKYEALFKIRRDIAIESKRIIFLLHSLDSPSKSQAIYEEAQKRLDSLITRDYKKMGAELVGEDPFRYHRVISPGNQEFVEALTLLEYMRDGTFHGPQSCRTLPFVPTTDYILGLADLTGELMRQAVSSIGSGTAEKSAASCNLMREIYTVMRGLPPVRELTPKLSVMETSVCKVERILYKLHVMGAQSPHRVLTCVQDAGCGGGDEGYHD